MFDEKYCQMYTSTIEQECAIEHCDGGSWYMDMPKGSIPYEEVSLHKECGVN